MKDTVAIRVTRGSVIAIALAGVCWTAALGQGRLENDPGYIDVSAVEKWFDDEPKIEVNVKGALLKLVAEASAIEDPDLADLLRRLRAIQVRGFHVDGRQELDVRSRTSGLASQLRSDGWETVVRVREDDEQVDMFVKMYEESIAGLVVMVVDRDEEQAIFVNVVGDIDPEQVGKLGRKFNIGKIEDL